MPAVKPVWPGAKVTLKLTDWPAAIVLGRVEVSSVNPLGAFRFTVGKEIAGVGVSTAVGLVSVKVIVLVALGEVLGKLRGEALAGSSTTGPEAV